MMSFTHSAATRYQTAVTTFYITTKIWFYFDAVHFIISINSKDFSLIKQNR